MSVKGQRQLEARNRERRKMEVEAEYWRKEAYAARGQAVAAEARARGLEKALELIDADAIVASHERPRILHRQLLIIRDRVKAALSGPAEDAGAITDGKDDQTW